MNLKEGKRARQTAGQAEITNFIKICGDSKGVGGQIYVTVKEQISGSEGRCREKRSK